MNFIPRTMRYTKPFVFSCMEYKWAFSGDKLQHSGHLDVVNDFDSVILSETWKHSIANVPEYQSVIQDATQFRKGVSNSGRIVLLYKNAFQDLISIVKNSFNFLWFKIKTLCQRHMYVRGGSRNF